MSDQALYKMSPLPAWVKPWVIPTLVFAAGCLAVIILEPNFSLIATQPLWIQIHLLLAVATFGLGAALLASRKGRTFHRVAGWIWAVSIFTVAFTSLFIMEINPGKWWFIHILSWLTMIQIPIAVWAARRHNVELHRRIMGSMYFGAMIVAGAFTFLPGRLMFRMFFGGE